MNVINPRNLSNKNFVMLVQSVTLLLFLSVYCGRIYHLNKEDDFGLKLKSVSLLTEIMVNGKNYLDF